MKPTIGCIDQRKRYLSVCLMGMILGTWTSARAQETPPQATQTSGAASPADDSSADAAPGSTLELQLRYRQPITDGHQLAHTLVRRQSWRPERTALIICDMWDRHGCYRAAERVTQLAPRLQAVASRLRQQGATIIHAPSDCMDHYRMHPARLRAESVAIDDSLPPEIDSWCKHIADEPEAAYPLDQSDGGCDDDPQRHQQWADELKDQGRDPKRPWKMQCETIDIDPKRDYITDSGSQVASILAAADIDHVIVAGVHTNMCVLGRPFGLRRLKLAGKNVVLLRDGTDTMYNPKSKPFVNHFTGTDLIVAYIERYICPTITSDQILGGDEFRFPEDRRPHVVMLVAEREYKTDVSLANFALDPLGRSYRTSFVYADENDPNQLVGTDVIDDADVLLISVRRRTLPPEQLAHVRRHIAAGKPVVGIRTASHAFHLLKGQAPPESEQWPTFDADVFGGNYHGHHKNTLPSKIYFSPITHSILDNVPRKPFSAGGSFYQTSPLANGTTVVAFGKSDGVDDQPVAWTYRRADGGRSFYTSLGHEDDFRQPAFRTLLSNAIGWSLNQAIPASP